MTTPTDWEERFNKEWIYNESLCCNGDYCQAKCAERAGEEIKQFIRETLQEERNRIVGVVEAMQKVSGYPILTEEQIGAIHYNQALTDVLQKITS